MSFLFKLLIARIYKVFLASNTKYLPLDLTDKNCLCLAPHPDDESIGLGGTLLKYGELFDIICLTNGNRGVKDEELSPREKASVRKEEFLNAMKKLNVKTYDFWEYSDDRKLMLNSECFEKINLADYDYIFIPNLIDQHRDHKAVSILLKELLSNKKHKKNLKIAFYEVWQTLPLPNFYVDITDVARQKVELIDCYKSQNPSSYSGRMLGLNTYRGCANNPAEAFCVVDEGMFKKICKIYSLI